MAQLTRTPFDIELFGRNADNPQMFESIATFDAFISLVITWNFQSFDEFSLRVPLTQRNVSLFQTQNVLLLKNCFFYIDRAVCDKDSDKYMTVSGKSLAGKLTKRIVTNTYSTNSRRPELIAYDLINKHAVSPTDTTRKIAYLSVQSPANFGNENISYQNSYGTVMDEVEKLMVSNDFGLREVITDPRHPKVQLQFYTGNDVSQYVEFTKESENVLTESYDDSIYDRSTVVYAFGEGEGTARKKAIVKQGNPTGIDLEEFYADERDYQSKYQDDDGQEVTLTDAEYMAGLRERGRDALAERAEVKEVNVEINLNSKLFEFGVDYNVGDRVTMRSTLFGMSKTAVITSMQESYEKSGRSLTPTFGNASPTIIDILKRG